MTRSWIPLIVIAIGCGPKLDPTAINDVELTLSSCDESLSSDLPDFFANYFACVDASVSGSSIVIQTDGLPPTPSAYYPEDDPNYVEYDDRGGSHERNPNQLDVQNYEMEVPVDPTPKGITIDASLVDNTMGTSNEEYGGGPQGIALNGVIAFAAMAAPGDDLADEQYTFDLYEGHPAGTTYHYHYHSEGPLEVLVDRGYSSSTSFGEGEVELYAVMCDGTVVMGCTELDRSTPDDTDFDAQNGHIHDISDDSGTQLADRYHTHVCPSQWPDYPFFPEIAYYDDSGCPQGGP
jgi:hypothetical protein